MKSFLEKQYENLLTNKNIQIISFDIFETLFFRNISNPKDIFYIMGHHDYIKNIFSEPKKFKEYRVEAEKKARLLHKNKDDITLKDIYNILPLNNQQKNKIMKIELETENNYLFTNKEIEQWIDKALLLNKKVLLISDMYLSSKHLYNFLKTKLTNHNLIHKLYVSSEYGLTKAKTKLFEYIQQEQNIQYENWLHIGDNPISDVKNPKKLGIQTLHYHTKNVEKMMKIEEKYIGESCNTKNIRILSSLKNPYNNQQDTFYFDFGATIIGPLLFEFSNWLYDICIKYDISQVNFITREGILLQKYFTKLFPQIETNIIEASRKSTYLASQKLSSNLDLNALDFFSHRDFTLGDFYNLYNVTCNNNLLNEYKNTHYRDSYHLKFNDKLLSEIFLEDIKQKENEILQNIIHQKQYFQEYFKQLNIKEDSILIDFGGGGTVLERINKIFDNKFQQFGLFYMHQKGFNRLVSTQAHSFLSNTNKTQYALELIARTPEFLEFLFNGIEKTAQSYLKNQNMIKVISKYPYDEIILTKDIFEALYKGIDQYFHEQSLYKQKEYNKEYITLMLARVIDVPTITEVNFLGNLLNDEGGGSSSIKTLINDQSLEQVKHLGIDNVYRNFLKNIRYQRENIHWIQGTITKLDTTYLQDIKKLSPENINEESINYLLSILDKNPHINKIHVYSTGVFLDLLYSLLQQRNIEVISYIDSKAYMESFVYNNNVVQTLPMALTPENHHIPIMVTSVAFAQEITDLITKYASVNQYNLTIINVINGIFKV